MQRAHVLIASLGDVAAQQRVVTWLGARFGAGAGSGSSETAPRSPSISLKEYLGQSPSGSKGGRLMRMLQWCDWQGEPEPSIRHLNELNRKEGGQTFSDAASTAQSLLKRGWLARPQVGRLALTPAGRAALKTGRT